LVHPQPVSPSPLTASHATSPPPRLPAGDPLVPKTNLPMWNAARANAANSGRICCRSPSLFAYSRLQ
jgi:hypothetical protein